MKVLKQIWYTSAGILMLFGPGVLGAYLLAHFGAPDWLMDIFVWAYILFVFVLILNYSMSCRAFSPNRGGWMD